MEKEYLVLVHGIMPIEHGMIDFDIDRGSLGRMVSRQRLIHVAYRCCQKAWP